MNETPARILLVDDEPDITGTLEYNLRREGYEVAVAGNGQEALRLATGGPAPDLVVLDLMLPDLSGTEVCRRLRENERTRGVLVLMLTARGEEIDRVVGFELGADDYVTKPFSVRELLLRIRALLRRNQPEVPREGEARSEGKPGERVVFGRLQVDPPGHRAWVEGEEVRLTALEFRLLTTFLDRKGRVQTRDALLNDVWSIHADVTTRTVDTHVKRLREKLGEAGAYIETIRGVGYRFRLRPEEETTS